MINFHAMAIAMAKGLFKGEKLEEPQKLYSAAYHGEKEGILGYYGECKSIADLLEEVSRHANSLGLDMDGETITVSECRPLLVGVDADNVIEQVKCDLYERCDYYGAEYDERFLDQIPAKDRLELQYKLDATFNKWLCEHNYRHHSYEYLPVGEFRCIKGKWYELEY